MDICHCNFSIISQLVVFFFALLFQLFSTFSYLKHFSARIMLFLFLGRVPFRLWDEAWLISFHNIHPNLFCFYICFRYADISVQRTADSVQRYTSAGIAAAYQSYLTRVKFRKKNSVVSLFDEFLPRFLY